MPADRRAYFKKYRRKNKKQQNAKSRERYYRNREQRLAYFKRYYKKNRRHILERISMGAAGVTSVDRPRPLSCEVCGNKVRICLDHCHTAKVFRGWLCNNCNSVLGHARDSITTLQALIRYLRKFQKAQHGRSHVHKAKRAAKK